MSPCSTPVTMSKYSVSIELLIIISYAGKRFDALLFNTKNLIEYYSFLCAQIVDFMYYYLTFSIRFGVINI